MTNHTFEEQLRRQCKLDHAARRGFNETFIEAVVEMHNNYLQTATAEAVKKDRKGWCQECLSMVNPAGRCEDHPTTNETIIGKAWTDYEA